MNTQQLIITIVLIGAGVLLQIWSSDPDRAGRQYALQLPSIFLYSLGGALLLFSLFPESLSEGRALGFTLGGATGFVAFFMMASFGWLSRTNQRDEILASLSTARKELAAAKRQLTAKQAMDRSPSPLQQCARFLAQIRGDTKHHIGFVTGNLANVKDIDVWVNTENTRMEMSRITEPTISGTVRYLGGRRDAAGNLIEDLIAAELTERMAGMSGIMAGQVVTTVSGELLESHGVRRIVHVAAVEGEPGSGYRQVRDVGRCVRNVLAELDRLNREGEDLQSVVLPLFGTGASNGDLRGTVETMVSAIVDYLRSHPSSHVSKVFLLAYTDAHEALCRLVLDLEPQLESKHL
ncbi:MULTISPECIES: hypothetical protein [Nocardiopsis]|uniref:Macro domain-containing protein n=1 Tax=Nocardiopsis akebiae TaxID=2831968 RepID=A0ABX8C5H6_9ACTN|nr:MULTISPECIES: hypothetical protein [Nocardiopsis]QUX29674.1 hypothetical protein KGD83_03600 [Nocardiopsis akebiae]WDZ90395.1 hypothetical protein PV789_26455 [Nocardiopsis sp. HUAS JQ3]